MNNPKISVIMSNYNGERYLEEAIKSILNQTFKDFEFIIIDDGSSDNSIEIIKRYKRNYKQIKLLINKQNLGIVKSLNRGLKIAKGKYIARMDSDDISLKERLKIEYDYLERNKDIFLVGSSYIVIKDDGGILFEVKHFYSKELVKKKLLKKCIIAHPTVMFHNDKKWYYREKAVYCEDYDLWLRLLQKGKNLVILKELLLKYRIRRDSICNSKIKQQRLFTQEILKWNKNLSSGKLEGYNEFNPEHILNKKYDNLFINRISYIFFLFKGKKMNHAWKEIKDLLCEKGIFKSMIKYFSYFLVLKLKNNLKNDH